MELYLKLGHSHLLLHSTSIWDSRGFPADSSTKQVKYIFFNTLGSYSSIGEDSAFCDVTPCCVVHGPHCFVGWRHSYPSQHSELLTQEHSITPQEVWNFTNIFSQQNIWVKKLLFVTAHSTFELSWLPFVLCQWHVHRKCYTFAHFCHSQGSDLKCIGSCTHKYCIHLPVQ